MDYIPDFLLSNGQFNWNAINIIVNGFLVFALVCITWWYANQVHKQTKLLIKSNKRNIIVDYIRIFLLPISNQLKLEILNIELNEFNWHQRNGQSKIVNIPKISDIRYGEGFAKNDVFREYSDLENLLSERDKLIGELIEVFEKIKETFEKAIQLYFFKDLIDQFNRSQKEESKLKDDEAIDNPIKYFMPYLINYESAMKYQGYDSRSITFLEEFGDKIVNCIEKTKLKELHEAKVSKLKQLIEKNRKTLERIQQIMADYRKEYYISENEIVRYV